MIFIWFGELCPHIVDGRQYLPFGNKLYSPTYNNLTSKRHLNNSTVNSKFFRLEQLLMKRVGNLHFADQPKKDLFDAKLSTRDLLTSPVQANKQMINAKVKMKG